MGRLKPEFKQYYQKLITENPDDFEDIRRGANEIHKVAHPVLFPTLDELKDKGREYRIAQRPGYVKTFAQGVARGTEGLAESVGALTRWGGEVVGSETIAEIGKENENYWRRAANTGWEKADTDTFQGTFMENPSLLRATGIVGEAVPSLASGAGAGGAAIKAGLTVGKAALASGLTLGALEGGRTYSEAREKGKSVGEASVYGGAVTAATGLLEATGIGKILGGKGGLVRRGVTGAIAEGSTEAAQTITQNLIAKYGYDKTREWHQGIVEAVIGGVGVGGPAGAISSVVIKEDPLVQQAIVEGMDPKDVDAVVESTQADLSKYTDHITAKAPQDMFDSTGVKGEELLDVPAGDVQAAQVDEVAPFFGERTEEQLFKEQPIESGVGPAEAAAGVFEQQAAREEQADQYMGALRRSPRGAELLAGQLGGEEAAAKQWMEEPIESGVSPAQESAAAFEMEERDRKRLLGMSQEAQMAEARQKIEAPEKPKTSKVRTVRGAIKENKGINFGNLKGELRDMPQAVKRLSSSQGTPIDVLEGTLKEEGWMLPEESLIEKLRDDPNFLRRQPLSKEVSDKPQREKTEQELQLEEQQSYEPEEPPQGDYEIRFADQLEQGQEITTIHNRGAQGWGSYKVNIDEQGDISLVGDETIELTPFDEIQVLKEDPDVQADIDKVIKPDIETEVQTAATSKQNDLPEPTQAQKEAGNYRKGHIKISGLDISVENPQGSVRSGVDESGKKWSTKMKSHYGYFKRTEGKDGDQVDTFIKPGTENVDKVYVVDQLDNKGGFDEHKIVLGVDNKMQARKEYLKNYDKGWKVGPITEVSLDEFKTWLGDKKKSKQPVNKEFFKKDKKVSVKDKKSSVDKKEKPKVQYSTEGPIVGFEKAPSGKLIGYKIMSVDNDGQLTSGADSRMKFENKIGQTIAMPGDGVFLNNKPSYVMDYYSGLADNEVLLKVEFDKKDIKFGESQLTDLEPEIGVSKAKILDSKKVTEDGEDISGQGIKYSKEKIKKPSSKPISQVDKKSLEALPYVQKVTGKEGNYRLQFKNNISIPLKTVELKGKDAFVFTPQGKKLIRGKFTPGKSIEISQAGDIRTVAHENFHFFESIGLLSGKDIRLLNRAGEKMFGPAEDKAELRAKYFEAVSKTAKPDSLVGKIVEKVKDFVTQIRQVFGRTAGGVVKDIEKGKLFDKGVQSRIMEPSPQMSSIDNTETPQFKKWSKGYDIVEGYDIADIADDNGKVFKVYHGTTHDFDTFDPSYTGNKEGHFGAVNYFTSDQADADLNYAGEGPDLTSRIEQRAEQLEQEIGENYDDAEIAGLAKKYGLEFDPEAETYPDDLPRVMAAKELAGETPQTLETFVRLDNPVYIGGKKQTYIENTQEEQYREEAIDEILEENDITRDEAAEYEDEIQERIYELAAYDEPVIYEALQSAINETGVDVDPAQVYQDLELYEPEVTATELDQALRNSESLQEAYDYDGEGGLVSSHVIGEVFRNLGFDGIVLQNANKMFPGMSMGSGTAHVHVFGETPTQIKSTESIGFDPKDPRIQYSTEPVKKEIKKAEIKEKKPSFADTTADITEEDYTKNFASSKNIKGNTASNLRKFKADVQQGIDKYLGALSTRLGNINPKLKSKMRKLSFDTDKKSSEDMQKVQPMLTKVKKNMAPEDTAAWDYARKNSDLPKINELIKKYGLESEYKAYRDTLDKIRKEALDVGLDVGYIEEYAPRILKDSKGFLEAIGKEGDWPVISRRLRERAKEMGIKVSDMNADQKADIISGMLHGGSYGLGGVPATKERKLKKIPANLNKFYMNSDGALVSHIHSMRKAIEARKFFGKVPELVANTKRKLNAAQKEIATFDETTEKRNKELLLKIDNLESKKSLTDKQEAELKRLNNALLYYKKSRGVRLQDVKDNLYEYEQKINRYKTQRDFSENIGTYVNDLIESGEISAKDEQSLIEMLTARFNEAGTRGVVQAYKNLSYIDTMGSPTSAITQIGDLAWSAYEAGLVPTLKNAYKAAIGKSRITKEDVGVERIAQEFADSGTLGKAVSTVFKLVGLEKMDSIGKESLLNSAFEKYQKQAKNNPGKLKRDIKNIFEGETDSVIEDLKNNEITDNVKLLVYNRLLDFQPVALSEMPQKYLTAGNGRIFYMLKSFTLKQFDVFRNEVYKGLKSKDPKTKIQAMKNFVRLSAFFVLANAGADELKDFILGRKTDLDDRVVDNLLRLGGISKFVTWKARTEGVGSAMVRQILPPFKFIDAATKDIVKAGDEKGLETLASLPVVGKLAYWHMGRGVEKRGDLWSRRLNKLSKKLKDVRQGYDESADRQAYAKKYRKELAKYRKLKNFKSKISKIKRRINKLKKMVQTEARSQTINRLEKRRVDMIKEYLKKEK